MNFQPTLFIDHQKNGRSGHLGHALAECKNGDLLAFYSNTSGKYFSGHTMYGWVEYRRSTDRGQIWGASKRLDYAYEQFLDGIYKIACEKAVVCADGTIVLFCLRGIGAQYEPYATPVCLISRDNGESWSAPIEVCNERGRIYDAVYREGRIYALTFCNPTDESFFGYAPNQFYKIFASDDNGQSFYEYSVLPFDTKDHAYGNMIFRPDGSLVFYCYCAKDEYRLTTLVSPDGGKSWGAPLQCPVAKGIRNPQVARLGDRYVLHGRGANKADFIFYTSPDGIHWDEGINVSKPLDGKPRAKCYYSNNLNVRCTDGVERLLVQYSELYEQGTGKVNIMHAWIK